jgi:AcrR family transcriptional regulator
MSVEPELDASHRGRQILVLAAEQFAEKGAKATTMRQIAAAAGMKAGSIYHHFASKDEMLVAILGDYLDDLNRSYRKEMEAGHAAADLIRTLIVTSLRTSDRHPHAAEIYQAEQHYLRQQAETFAGVLKAGRQSQAVWSKAIQIGYDDGTFRQDVPVDTFHRLLRDALWLSVRWYQPTSEYPVDVFASDIASVFLDGFLPRV